MECDQRTLVGFDFDNVWEIDPYCDYPYPQLKSNRQIRIVSVDIVDKPVKTQYEQGDSLDFTGGTVKITYEDETTANISITGDMVSGYDMNLIGEQNVTVSYSKRGNPFSVAQLKAILMNPVYIGKVRFDVRRNWSEKRRQNINPNPIIAEGSMSRSSLKNYGTGCRGSWHRNPASHPESMTGNIPLPGYCAARSAEPGW